MPIYDKMSFMSTKPISDNLGKLSFKDALRYALINYENKATKKGKKVERGQALKTIAMELIHIGINGSSESKADKMNAVKEIIDRLDGKAQQSIAGIEGEPITLIQRVIVSNGIDKDDSIALAPPDRVEKIIN
tara:strand:+ start:209 stop:607 length:399 start_codon:yes stop_codon:yes gene_type:complete